MSDEYGAADFVQSYSIDIQNVLKVEMGVMAMKRRFSFPKALELKPLYEMQFCVIYRTLFGAGFFPLRRDAVSILKPQPTELLRKIFF